MAKRRMKLKVRIDDYPAPGLGAAGPRGLGWSRSVYDAVVEEADKLEVQYLDKDHLEMDVILYMDEGQLRFHDVDNLTKHLFDALQGRLGGAGKAKQTNRRIAPSDAQIQRLTIEKRQRQTAKQRSMVVVTGYAHS
jgi:Holliday junction resolvase RusA-like endonuclease